MSTTTTVEDGVATISTDLEGTGELARKLLDAAEDPAEVTTRYVGGVPAFEVSEALARKAGLVHSAKPETAAARRKREKAEAEAAALAEAEQQAELDRLAAEAAASAAEGQDGEPDPSAPAAPDLTPGVPEGQATQV